jgi:serine/threonine protein kinase
MDKEAGKVYGGYRLEKLIGKGTYGYVYKARRDSTTATASVCSFTSLSISF